MISTIQPWKTKTRDIVLESCRKWRPNLVWDCSPVARLGDYVTISVFDGTVKAETQISLRLVWKAGCQRNFNYLKTITGKLLDDYYAQCEARRDQANAAAQAWEKHVAPRDEKAIA